MVLSVQSVYVLYVWAVIHRGSLAGSPIYVYMVLVALCGLCWYFLSAGKFWLVRKTGETLSEFF